MRITFDPSKDISNTTKHGISLRKAALLDWDTALVWADTRKEYSEPRKAALAILVNRVYFVVFVDRTESRRIISLRKANQREFDRYVTYINPTN